MADPNDSGLSGIRKQACESNGIFRAMIRRAVRSDGVKWIAVREFWPMCQRNQDKFFLGFLVTMQLQPSIKIRNRRETSEKSLGTRDK